MRLRLSQLSCGVSIQQNCGFSSSAPPPVKLAFERYGSSSVERTNPLVIGHGIFGSKRNWNSLSKELQKRLDNQIYAIDFRNHGDSPHADVHSYEAMVNDLHFFIKDVVLQESSFDSVHLLGHSMGGKVVSQFALSQSNLSQNGVIAKLIVEDIVPSRAYIASEFVNYIRAMKAVDLSKSRREISEQLKVVVHDKGILQFLMTNLDADAKQKNHFRWKCNLDALDKCLQHTVSFQVRTSAGKGCERPTLVVYGANSSYISRDDREEMLKMFPNAEFVEIPNAGHWLHAEQPRLFIDCLVEYLNK